VINFLAEFEIIEAGHVHGPQHMIGLGRCSANEHLPIGLLRNYDLQVGAARYNSSTKMSYCFLLILI